ncbi:MAG: hypothetical protein O7198_02595 [Wolbachia endosymbiont of Nomada marshamella]|nr:hypothetical protein [Wolbachia endosymbiont of Nomada marshamella]
MLTNLIKFLDPSVKHWDDTLLVDNVHTSVGLTIRSSLKNLDPSVTHWDDISG